MTEPYFDADAAEPEMDIVDMTVRPDEVFAEMQARKTHLLDQIKQNQTVAKSAYDAIAVHREELKTVNRLLTAAKPRKRTNNQKGKSS